MSTCTDASSTIARIERLLTSGLAPAQHREVHEHLRGCGPCRAYYDRLRHAEDALLGGATSAGVNFDRIGELVIAEVPGAKKSRVTERRGVLWFSFGLAATALAVVVVPGRFEPEFSPRGVAAVGAAEVGLELFRVHPNQGRVERLGAVPARVRAGDVLQLAYSNSDYAHAVVVGIDAAGRTQWYHPHAPGPDTATTPVVADAHSEPFGHAWKLEAPAGAMRVFAIFTRAPLASSSVERALEAARGHALATLEELPGLQGAQASLLLEIEP